MLAMRHIIYVLDEIEDITGSSISKSDMLDSFRKADASVAQSRQHAHEAGTLFESIERLSEWVESTEVKVTWFLRDSKYFINTNVLRGKLHLDQWDDPLNDAYPPPGQSSHPDGSPLVIPTEEDAPAVLGILQTMLDLMKKQQEILWPSIDRSADAESMRERSRDYEERIEGFMHFILEGMHPDKLRSFVHTLAKTPAALSEWMSRLTQPTVAQTTTDPGPDDSQTKSTTPMRFDEVVRSLLESEEGHGLLVTPYHGSKETDGDSPRSTIRVKCDCWPECTKRKIHQS
ncbi:uncharacterized protein STEHIDRAFT_116884 [Stereum hirsutum FP-91666 SS1]|uniref:uncharacterized protein n=1 Tax=Stereum hirsutum (strain FP-91666) TaxID=721885 RepID=UPI000440BBCA|nr:uncharacterized protein STEHIDRAFT_116884 [Stereum hirsutum FP-91666 SS1]EIM91716.1 hypothetical protein STEHIDRAFT_116884 [Stereum hirsutum FP-91666 SS1]